VLPFTNVGGDAANANFGDGLADELIGALGKVRGLKVAGRTSAFALGGRGLGVRAIADTLGVATVLEGSVQRAGGRLRVRAQLVSARDDAVLWSGTYDREPRDVFAVQDEIARAIVGALAPALGGARAPPRPPARDLATYELYLRARHFLNRRTDRDLRRGAEYFEQVIARDSGYAQAYAGLADAYVLMAAFGAGPPRETIPRARAAAATAVRLDPALAEAHAALGNIHHLFDWDWRAADREFAQALALDSSFSMAWAYRGILRVNDGRVDEGLADLSRSRALDPLSPTTLMHIGRAYLLKGRADSAAAHLRAVLELTPELARARQYLGDAYLQQGRVAEAVEAYRSAATRGAPADSARLAYALAVSGRRAEAERLLAALVAPSRRYLSPVPVATAYAALGDADAAFRWLERGLAERAAWMHNIATAPQLDRLHGDPRWARLVSRMGLVR
jgi:serine/threonine-protein kinase